MSNGGEPCSRAEVTDQRIGTGLVIGSGTSLARSGPASLFISYIIIGTVCCGVMVCLDASSSYIQC